MGTAPRRAARAVAAAMALAGVLSLLDAHPAAATQPPPPTASTAVQVAPASGLPGATISVSGQGFAPSVGYTLTVCPAPACAPGAPAQKCAVGSASNTGTVQCNFEIPQDDPPGDAVVTVYQDIGAGSPAATACPSPLTSPVATIPALPVTPPSPPAAPPVPLPNPGDQLTPCVRQASAILTILTTDDGNTVLPPLPPADLSVPTPPPLPAVVTIPTVETAPVVPAAPRAPVRAAPLRRTPIRAVAAGLPLRSLLPGTLLTALGALVFAGSLIPAPAPAAPSGGAAGAAAASRLRRFVQTLRR